MQTTANTGGMIEGKVSSTDIKPSVPASARIARLREQILAASYEADIERARYYTRSYQQSEGEPPCMRAASLRGFTAARRRRANQTAATGGRRPDGGNGFSATPW